MDIQREFRRRVLGIAVGVWAMPFAAVLADEVSIAAADEPPVAAQACLSQLNIRRSKVLNDQNILYYTKDRQAYNNALPKQCPGLRRDSPLSYSYVNSKLCAGSTFQVLLRVGIGTNTQAYTNPATNEHIALPAPAFVPGFVCQLGMFLPLTDGEVEDLMGATEAKPRRSRRSVREMTEAQQVELPVTEATETAPAETAPAETAPAETSAQ